MYEGVADSSLGYGNGDSHQVLETDPGAGLHQMDLMNQLTQQIQVLLGRSMWHAVMILNQFLNESRFALQNLQTGCPTIKWVALRNLSIWIRWCTVGLVVDGRWSGGNVGIGWNVWLVVG